MNTNLNCSFIIIYQHIITMIKIVKIVNIVIIVIIG